MAKQNINEKTVNNAINLLIEADLIDIEESAEIRDRWDEMQEKSKDGIDEIFPDEDEE